MSRSTFARHLPPCLVLCALFVLSSPPAHAQREAATADARLRALYTEEWNWRRQELARSGDQPGGASDRFPRVDAASQQARLAYWTRDAGDAGQHPVRRALARGEGERAGLPHLHPRARQRRAGSGPTKRRSTATPSSGPSSRRARASPPPTRIAPIWGASATCRATSTSRSPTCGPGSRAASPCRACRSSGATRRSSRT